MARNVPVGTIQSTVQKVYEAFGKIEKISEHLGIRNSTVSYGTEPERAGGIGVNYLHRLCQHEPACAAPLARHFARMAGGTFRPATGPLRDFSHLRTMKEGYEATAAQALAETSTDPKAIHAAIEETRDVRDNAEDDLVALYSRLREIEAEPAK